MSFLSVIVTTYNRSGILRVTLERLAAQTLLRDRYEVVVVDDGSSDETGSMVTKFGEQSPYRLRYLMHANRGPGYSQNRGIRAAQGPWILLLADDIQPAPALLAVHYQAHAAHPERHIAVAGKVVQSPDLPNTVFLRHWAPFDLGPFECCEELKYFHFWGCNVSFKKQFMLDHGMFVERAAAASEDLEVGWRLYRDGGMRLLYRQDALAYHYHPETIDSACRRAREQGANGDVLAESITDPEFYVHHHFLTRKTLGLFVKRAWLGVLARPRCRENAGGILLRGMVRHVLFNQVSVPLVILPLIRAAERNRMLAALVTDRLIRAVVAHYFFQGLSELRRRRKAAPSDPKPLPI